MAFSGWICIRIGLPIHFSNSSPTGYVQRALWAEGGCARKNQVDFQLNIQLQARHCSRWTNSSSSSRVCRGRRGASSQTCPSESDLETSFCQVEESPKGKRHVNECKEPTQNKQRHDWNKSVMTSYRWLGFGEVNMCIKQHCNVLVSCFQSNGQSITLILREKQQHRWEK